MASTTPVHFGNFELFPVDAGRFRLDGGAMFGVVPKTLWDKQIPSDEKNRIPMAMRCLLIRSETSDRVYLIDNGCGDKFNKKMKDIYALDYEQGDLVSSLAHCGVSPDEITDIIFTHLHFDHCGGTTSYNEDGNLQEVFPNAIYHVNERHWVTATQPNTREKASFLPENIEPLKQSGRLHLVKDYHTYEPGLSAIPADGHTVGQQLPVLDHGKTRMVYAADLLPTFAHIPLPWIMGYDMAPLQTLKEKEIFLNKASENQWFLFMEHDATHEVITVQRKNGKFSLKESFSLNDIS